jgi:hypothetical protein
MILRSCDYLSIINNPNLLSQKLRIVVIGRRRNKLGYVKNIKIQHMYFGNAGGNWAYKRTSICGSIMQMVYCWRIIEGNNIPKYSNGRSNCIQMCR